MPDTPDSTVEQDETLPVEKPKIEEGILLTISGLDFRLNTDPTTAAQIYEDLKRAKLERASFSYQSENNRYKVAESVKIKLECGVAFELKSEEVQS